MINSILYKTIGFHAGLPVEVLKNKYATPESKFVSILDMDVHYRITGQGPAVLLIHGIGSSLHTWSAYHKYLSKDFTVVSLDIPGFGLTGAPPKTKFTFDLYTQVFKKLLDFLKIETAHIVGNSLGGILTWQFALRATKKVNKIVLMDAVGFNTKFSDLSDIGFMLAAHPASKKLTYKVLPRSLVKSGLKNAVYNPAIITKRKVDLYADLLLRKGNRENFSHIIRNLIVTNKDFTSIIRSISQPTLIMWGEEDNLIPVNDAYSFKQAIPHAELIIYPKIGHLPMEENPEQSANDIKEFLLKS